MYGAKGQSVSKAQRRMSQHSPNVFGLRGGQYRIFKFEASNSIQIFLG